MSILIAFILALLLVVLFAAVSKDYAVTPLVIFFLILFLSGIAGNYWIVPFGPLVWGVSWMPVFFFVLIVALLLASTSPFAGSMSKNNKAGDMAASSVMSVFVWLIF